ncbi:Mobile element protein [Candidatus Burkholderia humilis]|nr:Mobile element protein [Candidatus Burkholderia humilis]
MGCGVIPSKIEPSVCLRDFLCYPWRTGRTAIDLAGTVIGPRIYEHEGIPVALRTEEVRRVLEVTRKDLSPVGLRDYAILTLLSTYRLRAAEVVNLRLENIDWRRDVLRVRHTKTGTYSELPLLREPGEAVLRYVEKARPPFWLMLRRLEADRFVWSRGEAVLELSVEQLHWLLEGIDLQAMRGHPVRYYEHV